VAHFARGARGALITPLRQRFGLAPSPVEKDPAPTLHDPAFDEFDGELELKIKAIQAAAGDPATGLVNPALYLTLTDNEWPDLYHRALMVVAAVEKHGYRKFLNPDGGKRDPAGLTAGLIGFTATHASLNKVLALIPNDEITAAFAAHGITPTQQDRFATFVSPATIDGPDGARRKLAIQLFQRDGQITPEWQHFLRDVLGSDSGRTAQHLIAKTFFAQGEKAAATNGIDSEFGKMLTFSINVQSFLSAKLVSTGSDRERRFAVTLKRAASIQGNMKNFEARHLQLARGLGLPNDQFIDLTAWGFDDPDDVPPERTRILSVGLSGSASMAALARFEWAARDKKLVQDSVTTSPALTERLAAAKVPFANGGDVNLRTPNFARAWDKGLADITRAATRRAYVEVLHALDELPLDWLLLGSESLGTGKTSGKSWLWSRAAPLTLSGRAAGKSGGRSVSLLAWKGDEIDLPFCPALPAGVVVLYATNGVAPGSSFGLRAFDAISTISGAPPIVLGWHGAVALPGRDGPTPEGVFLDAIKDHMSTLGLTSPRQLVQQAPERAVQAWGRACFDTYSQNKSFVPLWRKTKKKGNAVVVTSACAAIGPDRQVWLAKATPTNDTFMERV
jgi:hypothetical protein